MKVSESTMDEERMELINAVTRDAAELLDINLSKDPPEGIIRKVDDAIVALVLGKETPVAQDENPDLLLGCLWGSQMTRQFNWY